MKDKNIKRNANEGYRFERSNKPNPLKEIVTKKTTVVNIRNHPDWKAEGGVYIGRSFRGQRGSTFANPFKIGTHGDRDEVLMKYAKWLRRRIETHLGVATELEALRGKMLVCWCVPKRCHGHVIAEYLDSNSET